MGKKMRWAAYNMTSGVYWQNNIWRVQILKVCWFIHATGHLLSFYKACKTLNLDKIIQEVLKMLLDFVC